MDKSQHIVSFFKLVCFGALCLKPISEFGPGRLCPADCEASPKEPTLTHPRSPCFPPQTLKVLLHHHHHPKFSIIRPSPPHPTPALQKKIMKPKSSAILLRAPAADCSRNNRRNISGHKHVNSAGVAAEKER